MTNASEALEGNEGTIVISTEVQTFEAGDAHLRRPDGTLEPGEYVRIQVSDNGVGMTYATQAKIFDPFFSTKTSSRGLGLAAVQGIVLKNGGFIVFESRELQGTTFSIFFPRMPLSEGTCEVEREAPVASAGGRVLVVDDDPKLRELLVEVKKKNEITIDHVSQDEVIEAGFSADATDRARGVVQSFEQFIEDHKDEITALQILYSKPYKARLSFDDIKELADQIQRELDPIARACGRRVIAVYGGVGYDPQRRALARGEARWPPLPGPASRPARSRPRYPGTGPNRGSPAGSPGPGGFRSRRGAPAPSHAEAIRPRARQSLATATARTASTTRCEATVDPTAPRRSPPTAPR